MSQDLLAAFGDVSAPPTKSSRSATAAPSFSFFDDFNSNADVQAVPSAIAVSNAAASHNSQPSFAQQSVLQDESIADQNADDDWGDFEGSTEITNASSRPAQLAAEAAPVPVATQFSRWLDEEDDGFKDYSQTSSAPRSKGWDFTKPEAPASIQARPSQPRDPNVLFDADDEPPLGADDDDDDFGDFEEAEKTSAVAPSQTAAVQPLSSGLGDLLGIDSFDAPAPMVPTTTTKPQPPPVITANRSLLDFGDLTVEDTSTNAWKTEGPKTPIHGFGSLGPASLPKSPTKSSRHARADSLKQDMEILDRKPSKQPPASKQRNVLRKAPPPKPVAMDEDEKWDDFEAWEQNGPAQASPMPASSPAPPAQHAGPPIPIPAALTSSKAESPILQPPTNIPPPALVLSLFAPLFASAESSFFKPLRSEFAEVQQAIYAEAAALTYLKGLLALATVCGRVMAGRKHRWKRDTILAQSMRIGAAGGASGLKLTSIDKAEVAKEDREAADAVKAWSLQVGKLKSAVAEVKRVTGKDVGKIPELKESLPVKVAKEIEGGLKGNRPCALCGLKREERILKVDFEVEDSFGEWWVENISMHRDCRNFWEQHRDTLRSR